MDKNLARLLQLSNKILLSDEEYQEAGDLIAEFNHSDWTEKTDSLVLNQVSNLSIKVAGKIGENISLNTFFLRMFKDRNKQDIKDFIRTLITISEAPSLNTFRDTLPGLIAVSEFLIAGSIHAEYILLQREKPDFSIN